MLLVGFFSQWYLIMTNRTSQSVENQFLRIIFYQQALYWKRGDWVRKCRDADRFLNTDGQSVMIHYHHLKNKAGEVDFCKCPRIGNVLKYKGPKGLSALKFYNLTHVRSCFIAVGQTLSVSIQCKLPSTLTYFT